MTIKLHEGKSFSGRLGLTDERWNEIFEATKKPLMESKDTPEAIAMTVKNLKKVSPVEMAVIGYIVGSWNMKTNIMGGDLTKMLLASLLG